MKKLLLILLLLFPVHGAWAKIIYLQCVHEKETTFYEIDTNHEVFTNLSTKLQKELKKIAEEESRPQP